MESETNTPKPTTVDEYIAAAPLLIKEYLEQLRVAVLQTAPQAQECISYQMPAYKLHGILLYFGGFTKHVSLFPGSQAIEIFKDQLKDLKTSKGTIQFRIDKPLPTALIKKIVKYRVKENLAKQKLKAKKAT